MPNDWSEQSVPLTKHCKLQDINNATNKYVMAITRAGLEGCAWTSVFIPLSVLCILIILCM